MVGERFELKLVAHASALAEDHALELLEAPRAARIIEDEPGSVGRYRFSHALIREALHADLGALRAARLHWRVAEALEQLHGEDERRQIELADHAYQGAAAGDVDRACGHAARAAAQAIGRLAYEQAEQQLRRGLELVPRMAPGKRRAGHELDLQLRLGGLLI